MSTVKHPEQGEPWFDDGNLILQADGNVCFKVHRGVLARQSEIFRDMLTLPQPVAPGDAETAEVVRMYDLPVELSNLLMAIYDGVYVCLRYLAMWVVLTFLKNILQSRH